MRARLAIRASEQQVILREVVLRDKPQAMIDLSAKATVPVLVLPNGRVIDESLDVMRWALSENDPHEWQNGLDLPENQTLLRENDGPFKANLDRYKYPNRYDDTDPATHREAGLNFLKKLDKILSRSPYLSGSHFGALDAAIAPFIRQFANTDRAWFDHIGPAYIQKWLDEFLASDRFAEIMPKFKQWQPEDPITLF